MMYNGVYDIVSVETRCAKVNKVLTPHISHESIPRGAGSKQLPRKGPFTVSVVINVCDLVWVQCRLIGPFTFTVSVGLSVSVMLSMDTMYFNRTIHSEH